MPAIKVERDEHGALYRVAAFTPDQASLDVRKAVGRRLEASPHIDVWWDRGVRKDDEVLVIRQENGGNRADVIAMTQGQAMDLLHAVALAIKDI
jgi:hypothetical protein